MYKNMHNQLTVIVPYKCLPHKIYQRLETPTRRFNAVGIEINLLDLPAKPHPHTTDRKR